MQTRRDRTLIIALCVQAGLTTAASSAFLAQLFPARAVAGVGLLSAIFSAVTAMYVSLTQEPHVSPERTSSTS